MRRRANDRGSDMRRVLLAPVLVIAGLAAAQEPDPDRDGDGLSDFREVHKHFTDPDSADSDGDGIPDGDWLERREHTYTLRTIVQVHPPVDGAAINDDWQDARILHETGEYVELEVIHYPLNTVGETLVGDPDWRDHPKWLDEYLEPGPTANWDRKMRRDLLAALKDDGIDPTKLDDVETVRRVAAWLLEHADSQDGFTTFFTRFDEEGRPSIPPELSEAAERNRARSGISLEEQWERELFAEGMFRRGARGTCTSSAIYLNGCLRAVGIPTRIVLTIPVVDASDEREPELVSRITHRDVRRIVGRGVASLNRGGWTSHTFNEVWVGGRWRRLNYQHLGQGILGEGLFGLITHVNTFNDWADADMPSAWGLRQGLQRYDDVFGGPNPYSTLTLSDRFGEHCRIENPPEPAVEGLERMTIDSLFWSDSEGLPEGIQEDFAEKGQLALLAHIEEWEGFESLKRFTAEADSRFYLEAEGCPRLGIVAATGGITNSSGSIRFVVLLLGSADRRDLRGGVSYRLVPRNDEPTRLWVVREDLSIRRD